MSSNSIVQFTPFSSLIQPAFWHELTRLKLDVLKLSADDIPITASYTPGRAITDRETGKEVDLGCHLVFAGDAFEDNPVLPVGAVPCKGILRNYNTLDEFKAADKSALLNHVADQIWAGITSPEVDSTTFTRFILITFADLKKYKYYYWLGIPALVARPAWNLASLDWTSVNDQSTKLSPSFLTSIHSQLHATSAPSPSSYFLVRPSPNGDTAELAPLSSNADFWVNVPEEKRILAFVDPSAAATHPGWPLRNALAFLQSRYKAWRVHVLCWRDSDPRLPSVGHWRSRFGVVEVPGGESATGFDVNTRPSAVGWEKNPQGKLGPRLADLAPMMDPTRLADQAVDLNLKLMRWRILPSLDLEIIAGTKCLLLGAGTLGCYVARSLMAWGVRTITFVDSATVSFSNPVRQPLFEFADCLAGGKPKAQCAADSLKRIFPGVNASGVQLNIPMPGHPIPAGGPEDAARKDVAELEQLIKSHDVVFLLMDSRESRWLPTVLGKAYGKIVMNAALGFDSYLVMRHGARVSDGEDAPKLGCYYCNDVVAPADSLTDRTLDQMCTVTRPGLAAIASASAVELLVSLLQHPAGVKAPAPPPDHDYKSQDVDEDSVQDKAKDFRSVLGVIPHQLRGFLAQFRTLPIVGAAYDRCTGCSETVIKEYEKHGFAALLRAFNEIGYLERLTGLDKLQNDTALEAVDWAEEDDDDTEL